MNQKELIWTLTAKDFRFDYFRGSGKGGQKRNKTSSACRCVHKPSGAIGTSDDTRSQPKNRVTAWRRCINTEKFKKWHRLETARRLGKLAEVEDAVELAMRPENLRIEGKEAGKWTPIT